MGQGAAGSLLRAASHLGNESGTQGGSAPWAGACLVGLMGPACTPVGCPRLPPVPWLLCCQVTLSDLWLEASRALWTGRVCTCLTGAWGSGPPANWRQAWGSALAPWSLVGARLCLWPPVLFGAIPASVTSITLCVACCACVVGLMASSGICPPSESTHLLT